MDSAFEGDRMLRRNNELRLRNPSRLLTKTASAGGRMKNSFLPDFRTVIRIALSRAMRRRDDPAHLDARQAAGAPEQRTALERYLLSDDQREVGA